MCVRGRRANLFDVFGQCVIFSTVFLGGWQILYRLPLLVLCNVWVCMCVRASVCAWWISDDDKDVLHSFRFQNFTIEFTEFAKKPKSKFNEIFVCFFPLFFPFRRKPLLNSSTHTRQIPCFIYWLVLCGIVTNFKWTLCWMLWNVSASSVVFLFSSEFYDRLFCDERFGTEPFIMKWIFSK